MNISRRLTEEEVDKRLKEKGLERLSQYLGTAEKTLVRCHCGGAWTVRIASLLAGQSKSCGCNRRRWCSSDKTPLTAEEASKRLKEHGFELIGDFLGTQTKVNLKCLCGNVFETKYTNIVSGNTKSCGCLKKKNLKERIKLALEAKGLKLIGTCTSYHEKTELQCHCGKAWNTTLQSVLGETTKGCGCGRGVSMRGIVKMTREEAANVLEAKGFKLLSDYYGTRKKVTVMCHCGAIFSPTFGNVVSGCTTSCGCIRSRGEREVMMALKKRGVEYVKEWTRGQPRQTTSLRYDFYLPLYNAIIEFNGKQHFEVITGTWFGGDKDKALSVFNEIKANDKEKRDWAAANGIPLLDINYDEIDQVEDKVWNFLMELRARKNEKVA